jgi:hypothetical protein
MASLDPALAPAALADVDVELAVNGLAGDLHLELLGDVSLVERPAAVGAAVRQRCLVDFIDLFRAGRLAVGLGAIGLARLAARLLGPGGGLALGEGGGLALASAGRLVELAAETLVLGLEVTQGSLEGLAAGTRDGLHTSLYAQCRSQLRSPRPQSRDQHELDALNKYGGTNTGDYGRLTLLNGDTTGFKWYAGTMDFGIYTTNGHYSWMDAGSSNIYIDSGVSQTGFQYTGGSPVLGTTYWVMQTSGSITDGIDPVPNQPAWTGIRYTSGSVFYALYYS